MPSHFRSQCPEGLRGCSRGLGSPRCSARLSECQQVPRAGGSRWGLLPNCTSPPLDLAWAGTVQALMTQGLSGFACNSVPAPSADPFEDANAWTCCRRLRPSGSKQDSGVSRWGDLFFSTKTEAQLQGEMGPQVQTPWPQRPQPPPFLTSTRSVHVQRLPLAVRSQNHATCSSA